MQYQIKLQDYESLAGRIDKVQEYVEKEKRRDVRKSYMDISIAELRNIVRGIKIPTAEQIAHQKKHWKPVMCSIDASKCERAIDIIENELFKGLASHLDVCKNLDRMRGVFFGAQVPHREVLNDEKMKVLFGAKYQNIVYYNFDTRQWNTDKYNGVKLKFGKHAGDDRGRVKREIESRGGAFYECNPMVGSVGFRNKELVAVAVMQARDNVEGYRPAPLIEPEFDATGRVIAGTIVLRDKWTGKLINVPNQWVVFGRMEANKVSQQCADRVVDQIAMNDLYRRRLLEIYGLGR